MLRINNRPGYSEKRSKVMKNASLIVVGTIAARLRGGRRPRTIKIVDFPPSSLTSKFYFLFSFALWIIQK